MKPLRPSGELFIRWMELGALVPFFRVHCTLCAPRQEPWSFGRQALERGHADQCLLGDRVMVAPVLDKGVTRRNVWLPSGRSTNWLAGQTRSFGMWSAGSCSVDGVRVVLQPCAVAAEDRRAAMMSASIPLDAVNIACE